MTIYAKFRLFAGCGIREFIQNQTRESIDLIQNILLLEILRNCKTTSHVGCNKLWHKASYYFMCSYFVLQSSRFAIISSSLYRRRFDGPKINKADYCTVTGATQIQLSKWKIALTAIAVAKTYIFETRFSRQKFSVASRSIKSAKSRNERMKTLVSNTAMTLA